MIHFNFRHWLVFFARAVASVPVQASNRLFRQVLMMLLLLPCLLGAQHVFRNYSTINGMPSSTVYSCIQDSTGFLWFATDKGLCRFDGSDFQDFSLAEYEEGSMTTLALVISEGHIIAGTFGGFMSINDNMRAEKLDLKFEGIDCESHKIAYDEGYLYFRTNDNAVVAYNVKQHKKYIIGRQDAKQPFCMLKTPAGKVYYGQEGLYAIRGLTAIKFNIPVLNHKEIASLSIDAADTLWVSCKNTIYKLRHNVVVDSLNCGFYAGNPLFVNNSSVFGLVIYDHYGNGNSAYHELKRVLNNGSRFIITGMFEDRDKNLWVNTYNKGTYCILNTYISTFSGQNDIYDAAMHDVYVDEQQETYMATSEGVLFKKGNAFYELGNAKEHFYYNIVRSGKRLLMAVAGTDTVSLSQVYDTALQKTYYQLSARRLCLMNDSSVVYNYWDNQLRVATLQFDKGRIVLKDRIILDSVVGRCMRIFKKNQSQVIVSTIDACYLVDLKKRTSSRMKEVRSKVNDIIKDAAGSIYMASEAGLYIIKNGRVHLVREINGVPLKNLSSLALDAEGRLWIGFNKGLLIWKGNFLKRISGSPFLRSNEINKLFYEKRCNKIYVATNSGLSIIDIDKMDRAAARNVDLILLRVQSKDSIYDLKKSIRLLSAEKGIDIYFSAIEISSPQDLYFRYTLNNGRTWTIINSKKISLNDLSYGGHRVIMQASNDGIRWGKKAEITFYVDYPFYTTIKFWARVLVLITVIVFLLVKLRIRKIREKAIMEVEFQQKLEDLRYQALNAAVNPHFIFNTLGAIQSFVISKDPFQASDYIAKFARLIRITLNHAGQKYISIDEEINRLAIYLELEKLRNGNKLEYTIHIDPSTDRFANIPNMIIQPLIENAILHGILPLENGVGKIEVNIKKEGHFLVIGVQDNGVGIDHTLLSKHGYKSIGLSNLKERLSLVKNAFFEIKNRKELYPPERGTLVVIRLPL